MLPPDSAAARDPDGHFGPVGPAKLTQLGPTRWLAEARVRLPDGAEDVVTATGPSAAAAEATVRERGLVRAVGGPDAGITDDMTLLQLAERTLAAMRADQVGRGNKIQTINMYERHVKFLRGATGDPPIGLLPLRECTAPVVIAWLEKLSQRVPTSARHTKVLLLHSFSLAMRHGINLWSDNPARRARLKRPDRREPVVLTEQETAGLWRRIRDWEARGKRTDLSGIIGFQMATGARSSEVLALRWSEVDLTARPPTATISGTLVRQDGVLLRQNTPKSSPGYRTLTLPAWCAGLLRERRASATHNLVFPSQTGGLLDPHNIGSRFRDARGEEYGHIRQKDFRSTVGTLIARAHGSEAAARQLGHSNPAMTHRHYIKRSVEAGDHTGVLDGFDPIG